MSGAGGMIVRQLFTRRPLRYLRSGDVVRRAGGPHLEIEQVSGDTVVVSWWDAESRRYRRASFAAVDLCLVPPGKSAWPSAVPRLVSA